MNKLKQLLLISSSKVHGFDGFLAAAEEEIKDFLNQSNVSKVLFIPYANPNHDKYLETVQPAFKKFGFDMDGIHQYENPTDAINKAQAVFVGGGNTFLLLKTLYEKNLLEVIRKRVVNDGLLYIGSSAGTNVATRSINTSNDMPIVHPPSFDALSLVPFNINPHYLETDVSTKHKGETRDERILEFLAVEDSATVLGLREGSMLRVSGPKAVLKGIAGAKLFTKNKAAEEYTPNADLSFLLQ